MSITQGNKENILILDGGILAYVKVAEPDYKYQSNTEKEYSLDYIVDKATAKEWNKRFPKQKAKEIDEEDFERIFKIPHPFGGGDVFVIKLRRDYKEGGIQPRVILSTDSGNVDITESRLVANGSKGKVSVYTFSNDYGTFARLQNVLIPEEDFIEYKKQSKGAGSEFGVVVSETEPENKAATEARENASKDSKPADDFEDDIPF